MYSHATIIIWQSVPESPGRPVILGFVGDRYELCFIVIPPLDLLSVLLDKNYVSSLSVLLDMNYVSLLSLLWILPYWILPPAIQSPLHSIESRFHRYACWTQNTYLHDLKKFPKYLTVLYLLKVDMPRVHLSHRWFRINALANRKPSYKHFLLDLLFPWSLILIHNLWNA